jgi:hypothetical protein
MDMRNMREAALRMAARPTALDPPSRSALFSASALSVGQIGLDLASGTSYSSGVMVSTTNEVFISIETPFSACLLLIKPDKTGDDFLYNVYGNGWFTLVPEGQIPVAVDLPIDEQSAHAAYARFRSWT